MRQHHLVLFLTDAKSSNFNHHNSITENFTFVMTSLLSTLATFVSVNLTSVRNATKILPYHASH